MRLSEFVNKVEDRIAEVVRVESLRVASELRADTPTRRVKTRQAVRVRQRGTRAVIGLRFAQRFGGNNTATHQRLRMQWGRLRPVARQRVIEGIREAFSQ